MPRDSRSIRSSPSRRCAEFDVIGFSLQYEVSYVNVLTMLDLGGVALHATDRTLAAPLVLGGGPCARTPNRSLPFVTSS